MSLQISLAASQVIATPSERAVPAEVNVGERLRAIRHLRRATLKAVAERARLSESFLSQIERGKANASIASLTRIAAALGVNVADLFEPHSSRAHPRVLRRDNRPALAFGNLGRKYLLTPRPLEHLEVFAAEHDPGRSETGPLPALRRLGQVLRDERPRPTVGPEAALELQAPEPVHGQGRQ